MSDSRLQPQEPVAPPLPGDPPVASGWQTVTNTTPPVSYEADPPLTKPRPQGNWLVAIALGGGIGLVVVLAILASMRWSNTRRPLEIVPVGDQRLREGETLEFQLALTNPLDWTDEVAFSLVEGPDNAEFDAAGRTFRWTPGEDAGPGEALVRLQAATQDGLHKSATDLRIVVEEAHQPPQFEPVAERVIRYGESVSLLVSARDVDRPSSRIRYSLDVEAPPTARIDRRSGHFLWQPEREHAGSEVPITVLATKESGNGPPGTLTFRVRIKSAVETGPIDRLVDALRQRGADVKLLGRAPEADFQGTGLSLLVNGEKVLAFEYHDEAALAADAGQISRDGSTLFGQPREWPSTPHFYQGELLLVMYIGQDRETLSYLTAELGDAFAVGATTEKSSLTGDDVATLAPVPEHMLPGEPIPEELRPDESDEELIGMFQRKSIASPDDYGKLRKIWAERFARQHQAEIQAAFTPEVQRWLDNHADVREEFYNALSLRHDKLQPAMELLGQIVDAHAQDVPRFRELAIAVAVTWDDPSGIRDYAPLAKRIGAPTPTGEPVDALGNFEYLLGSDAAARLPWEFLVYSVNHATPLEERRWAAQFFASELDSFGRLYDQVPYDDELYGNPGREGWDERDYTLRNIRLFGGTRHMRADYAARLGKSLGLPTMFVHGERIDGEPHAWVTWVDLEELSADGLKFNVATRGRDAPFGRVLHPQSGQTVSDRDVELELQAVGFNVQGKRQASLIMKSYPILRRSPMMTPANRITLLSSVTQMSPGSESAWLALAEMCNETDLERRHRKSLADSLDRMFLTFAKAPDVLSRLIDDALKLDPDATSRAGRYARFINVCEGAGRADLAIPGRLKWANMLAGNGQKSDALAGLAITLTQFAGEDELVPKAIDELEKLAAATYGGDEFLDRFWLEFVDRVPTRRRGRANPYGISMYERAIAWYTKRNMPDVVAQLEAKLLGVELQ